MSHKNVVYEYVFAFNWIDGSKFIDENQDDGKILIYLDRGPDLRGRTRGKIHLVPGVEKRWDYQEIIHEITIFKKYWGKEDEQSGGMTDESGNEIKMGIN